MKTLKEKVSFKLRNYGFSTKEKIDDAEFIIDRTLKDVLKLIDEWGDVSGLNINKKTRFSPVFSIRDIEELKQKLK